ncbi:hypothetical protein HD806DRAFT_483384 [Xylariaceae sp. AK1471]|nr:hypothetical protein HD806DRAFT_483384 [Xylariaceae sp. AK1471]
MLNAFFYYNPTPSTHVITFSRQSTCTSSSIQCRVDKLESLASRGLPPPPARRHRTLRITYKLIGHDSQPRPSSRLFSAFYCSFHGLTVLSRIHMTTARDPCLACSAGECMRVWGVWRLVAFLTSSVLC